MAPGRDYIPAGGRRPRDGKPRLDGRLPHSFVGGDGKLGGPMKNYRYCFGSGGAAAARSRANIAYHTLAGALPQGRKKGPKIHHS